MTLDTDDFNFCEDSSLMLLCVRIMCFIFHNQKIALSFLSCDWFLLSLRAISASAPIFAYTGMNNCEVYQLFFYRVSQNSFALFLWLLWRR